MRCPECGREMRLSKEESIESFKEVKSDFPTMSINVMNVEVHM